MLHSPVLLQQVIKNLAIKPEELFIDTTAGEGGHLIEILKAGGRVLGIDIDQNQIKDLNKKFKSYIDSKKLVVGQGNFSDLEKIAKKVNFFPVSGILIDLGLSYKQISLSGKGFSYKKLNEKLDMRLDNSIEQSAANIVNSYTEDQLYELFAKYSEDLNSRPIAEGIVRSRAIKKIETVENLLEVLKRVMNKKDVKTEARIFQALRIKVNNEMDNLKKALLESANLLVAGGRLLVISFHSLEDRTVKSFVKKTNYFEMDQIIKGSRDLSFERSAKLRVLIKKIV
ncbi:MAG: 16S rRNA (cytosine(1402)-N(4))-methyltransferase RsmH [Patescibacteria group bacterium]